MSEIKFDDLLGSGAHFGHVTRKWNPNFKPYILLEKNGVHLVWLAVVQIQSLRSTEGSLDHRSSDYSVVPPLI